MKLKYSTLSLSLTALAVPLSILSGFIVMLVLKNSNSTMLDITRQSAYTKQAFIAGFITFAVCSVLSIVLFFVSLKEEPDSPLAKLTIILLAIITLISLAVILIQGRTTKIESTYKDQQLKKFFEVLSK